jgi:hypothetical protein
MRVIYTPPPWSQVRDPSQDIKHYPTTVEQFDALIDEVHRRAATWPDPIEIGIAPPPEDEGTPSISLVVGCDRSAVYWEQDLPGDDNQWSETDTFWSWNGTDDEDPPFEVVGGGSKAWLPAWTAIPIADAREAVRRFFLTGERPDNIAWRFG